MSVINNSGSLLKSIDALNCETSKSSIIIKNITLNTNKSENLNKICETAIHQPTDALDYYSFSSDTNEMYYSDSEGSKLLILPQRNTLVHNMPSVLHPPSSSDSDVDYSKVMNNKPLATSSPLSKLQSSIRNKYYWKKTSKKVSIKLKIFNDDIKSKSSKVKNCYKNSNKNISSCTARLAEIPNLSNKTTSPNHNNMSIAENQENTDQHSKHSTFNNIKQVSQKSLNDVTNILYTNQSQITLQKSSFTTNTTSNKKSKNNAFQLNAVSDKTVNSNRNESNKIDLVYSLKSTKSSTKNKIEENQTLYKNTTIICNNSQTTYNINKQTTSDENYLNNADLSDIFQMELSLKMFSGNIVPYLNSMKHEILQIMNKCMYKPDEQIIKISKNVNDIIKNIHNIMKANMYNFTDSLSNKKDYSTLSFVDVDLNNLNVLNNKLECIKKKLEQIKLCENILNDQEDKSTDQLCVQNDFLECKSLDNLKSFNPATDNTDAEISSIKTAALDSFSCLRELDKSNSSLQPINDCININESSQKQFLENCSLICINDLQTNEISKTMAQDLNFLSYNEPLFNKLAPINNDFTGQSEDINNKGNPEGKNQSRYWLRKNPKSTEHYFSPFLKTHLKTPKKSCIKSKFNDMFVCKGTGNKKVIHQYKLKSVLKADSDELIKIICPENKKLNNGNQNTTTFDISNLKPKKIEKICRCGIFPSQVPSSWNDSLHTSLHKNLHKLQFKSQLPVNAASKVNVNGFLFNIIKVTENCDDLDLRLTLKNIQDFIHLEIDFSKKSINNLNHTIFLAVDPKFKIIGYLEIEPLTNACIYQNSQISKKLIAVKFGISKLWVMVKYRNNGVATKLIKQFCDEENLQTNDIAFAFHGNHGLPFIKKHFANNSVLIY